MNKDMSLYQLIADESGQSRANVKWLIMKMISAPGRSITLATDIDEDDYFESKFVMTAKERELIEAVIQRLFQTYMRSFTSTLVSYYRGWRGHYA
jgi:5'-3' exonuclease